MKTITMDSGPDARTCTWRDWSCAVRVTVQHATAGDIDRAVAAVRGVMSQVAHSADRFDPRSDVSRVNANAGRMIPVRPLTLELVGVALDAARITDGACDPTIGGALVAAGYDADIDVVRARMGRALHPLPALGWESVRVDDRFNLVGVRSRGRLDLGATAKAWAADRAASRAAAATGRAVLVSLGGDLAVAGGGRTWHVDVGEHEGGVEERVDLTHGAVTTSSTHGRRWATPDGERHHVIDPRTGRCAEGPWRTCSVWAPSAVVANTASTAALVVGADAIDWLRANGHAARLVGRDGLVSRVGGWPGSEDRAA